MMRKNWFGLLLFCIGLFVVVPACASGTFSCSGDGEIIEDDAAPCPVCECTCTDDAGVSEPDAEVVVVPDASNPDAEVLPPDAQVVLSDAALPPDALVDAAPPVPDAALPPDAPVDAAPPDAALPPDAQVVVDAAPPTPDASLPPDAGVVLPPASLEVPITLRLNDAVLTGGDRLVTFAVPLPSGLVDSVDNVRLVTEAGVEVPAYYESLGKWNAIAPAALRCSDVPATHPVSVRSVLVQFNWTMAVGQPVKMKLQIGQAHAESGRSKINPTQTWRTVNEGTYVSSDSIREPVVWGLVDNKWLACSGLVPMHAVVGSSMDMVASDLGQKDFFYTIVNIFFDNLPVTNQLSPYKTDYEPWLYDRPQAMFNLYVRSGNFDALREAYRATADYRNKVYEPSECGTNTTVCPGYFAPKDPTPSSTWKDSKYIYNESFATLYWLTGDTTLLPFIDRAAEAQLRANAILTSTTMPGGYTERFWATAYRAVVVRYEVTGLPAHRAQVVQAANSMRAQQTNPSNPWGPVTGCFNSDWEGSGSAGFSPWMSTMLQDSFVRAYMNTGEPVLVDIMTDLSQCIHNYGLNWYQPHPSQPLRLAPFYGAQPTGRLPVQGEGEDFEHAIDVAAAIAVGAMFETNPTLKATLEQDIQDLLNTHEEYTLPTWTRATAGYPRFRVTPPRKYAWWYKTAGFVGWYLGRGETLN